MRLSVFLIFSAIFFLSAGRAIADNRSYVWTYEYLTLSRGEAEIEWYMTLSTPNRRHMKGTVSTQHKIELEVGMTDRFDFAVYQVFSQAPGSQLSYDGYQLRARYRIGEKGDFFLDLLIYLEYGGVPDFSEHVIEAKLILARDFGRFNLALNPIVEHEIADENETELEYAAGIRYEVSRLFRVGVEAKGGEGGHYLGPVISHGGRYWVAFGSAFNVGPVDPGKPQLELRLLMGIGL